ncbi:MULTISPECIES: class 1 fructose-bisphosphatase [unclassified Marinobacterium]|jgi:fructose-1,6-bisphosphatase I|uniref:class 1 fructose-bisphosphatase n=1 Tax=unclassified Marinobacterium TaxID=2644139 RepID=UPI00156A0F0B|nr:MULTISPECIES: class 1 fructose-bisphosphatase [unclassified Marinobacterium]NRP09444.1 Fructose-1,6-bisphosphatase class 1 [Marinobacterium sp. xm-g-48]NRP16017.1 Fructose-1,6-bisphosphatase class 1 [Marinobacterium sp. xm-a-152]NRP26783.1 Fructose-1,6-bisphosphatase class 1 [Marinobacterium sp. xm-d-420]NRP35471.1 Fructose-1,6-bisphosphatase class 1 [Marinobacterium sp. xm-d-579]NRP46232.1 Fructose-1,6-bisphosphatase class 1 [Marinobacterium sp. xm-d-543]
MQLLSSFLKHNKTDADLVEVIEVLMIACKEVALQLREGALAGVLGTSTLTNVQGETQKKLDIVSNDIIKKVLLDNRLVRGVASEEEEEPVWGSRDGRYLVTFDPLDGSSNIDINVSVGTIFSIIEAPKPWAKQDTNEFLQPGRKQVAAGYVLYGPSAVLALTTGSGVNMFTLAHTGDFILTEESVKIPEETSEFSINMSNKRHWEPQMQEYIDDLLLGEEGPREKNYNMRWVASMVAEVHRLLTRGGIFTYPWDSRDPGKPGKLRLMYEGNPMSFLIEQAGGVASTCYEEIMDLSPEHIHQRVSVALGSKQEVEMLKAYHRKKSEK